MCTIGESEPYKNHWRLQRLQGVLFDILVIDAGWYRGSTAIGMTATAIGCPIPICSERSGCHGCAAIRAQGLCQGCGLKSRRSVRLLSLQFVQRLLRRDGVPITVGQRRFWDLSDPIVVTRLKDQVIGLLQRNGFGYLKIDYNESLGIGCDHPDSQGEGCDFRWKEFTILRFCYVRNARLGDRKLCVWCHRLEPSMLARSAMSSFSDAHETIEIPIIAGNLQSRNFGPDSLKSGL